MKTDTAVIMSFHEHEIPGTWRINLKWQGNHEISDFKLDLLGEVLGCETETEDTGWAIVKPRGGVYIGETIPYESQNH